MSQISISDAAYVGKRKKTRREVFLEEMEVVVPRKALLGLIEPHYPVAGRGRGPCPLEAILRVHLMQNWFALCDPAMEEALYEIASLRAFAHLGLDRPISDETTILHFRHLLEANERDPEMHQIKKGSQWHFGTKAHIAVDAHSGLVHTVTTTAANEADVEQVADLLHGEERQVWADSGYRGAQAYGDHEELTAAVRPRSA